MKKRVLFLLVAAALWGFSYDSNAGHIVLKTPENCSITGMSPNGRYVCGNEIPPDGVRAFFWDLHKNEFVWLSSNGEVSSAFDVSDNGIVAGIYANRDVSDNGAAVESGGYWKEGVWHSLENFNGVAIVDPRYGTYPQSISADGQYIAGAVVGNKELYTAALWKNGFIERVYDKPSTGKSAVAWGVNNDGTMVCGWTEFDNRVATIWTPELKKILPFEHFSCGAQGFSDNGKYVVGTSTEIVAGSEWNLAHLFVYDVESGETTDVPTVNIHQEKGASALWVGDDKTFLFQEEEMAAIYKPGMEKSVWLKDYLKEYEDIDITKYGLLELWSARGISRDGNVIVGDGLTETGFIGYVVLLNQDAECGKPAYVSTSQLRGLPSVKVSWSEPLANADKVKGYNVFKNAEKINGELVKGNIYFDNTTKVGEMCSYEVVAVYADCESELSVISTITVVDPYSFCNEPRLINGRASGYNDALLHWTRPTVADATLSWTEANATEPFGRNMAGNFHYGVRYTKQMVACYPSNMVVKGVNIAVMDQPAKIEITIKIGDKVIYKAGVTADLTPLANNSVELSESFTIGSILEKMSDTDELYLMIKVTTESDDIYFAGLDPKFAQKGYSDLVSEDGSDWVSIQDLTRGAIQGSWVLGLNLENADGPVRKLAGYNVYRDGVQVAMTKENLRDARYVYVDNNLSGNDYKYSVDAVYRANGVTYTSAKSNTLKIKLSNNDEPCRPPSAVKAYYYGTPEVNDIEVLWDSPMANEKPELTYTNWKYSVPVTMSNPRMFVAMKFDKEQMSLYEGFVIDALSFQPVGRADKFILHIFEDGEAVYYQELKGYTINKRSVIPLDEKVAVNPDAELMISIEAVGKKDAGVFGLDTSASYVDYGDLYSESGDYYLSAYTETGGSTGNWLMGVILDNNVKGTRGNNLIRYDVYMGDNKITSDPITENSYRIVGNTAGIEQPIKVAAIYSECEAQFSDGVIPEKGSEVGVDNIERMVSVYPNPVGAPSNYKLHIANIDVTGCKLFDVAGKLAKDCKFQIVDGGAIVDMTGLQSGVYMLSIETVDGVVTKRVAVSR